MLRVVVAEDEYYSRKVLIKLLEQIPADIEICAEAETGQQIVDYLEKETADLVITDIRMPEMDGLQLASYVAQHLPASQTKVIIISGYSDFEYAREAIGYGVKNYLTKPVKFEELKETVLSVIQSAREQEEAERLKNRKSLQDSLQYINMTEIVQDKELLELLLGECRSCFDGGGYRMFVLQNVEPLGQERALALYGYLKSQLSGFRAFVFFFRQYEEFVVLVFDREEALQKNRYSIFFNRLIQKQQETDALHLTAGASRIYAKAEQLGESYRDSIYAINRRLLEGKCQVYEYEPEINPSLVIRKEQEIILHDSILNYNYQQAADVAEHIFERAAGSGMDIYTLYSSLMQLFNIINRACCQRETRKDAEENGRYLLFSFKSDLYTFHQMASLQEYVLGILKHTCGIPEVQGKSSIVEELIDYVSRNYQYDISLNELALHKYFMNPSYLSRLFKAETGTNFSKYLSEFRLKRAKELLENTIFKVNEIAVYVGYNDTSHFIQVFKKYNKMTPEQYRGMFL